MAASSSGPSKRQRRLDSDVLRQLLGTGVSENSILQVVNKLRDQTPIPSSTFKRQVHAVLTAEASLFRTHHLPSNDEGNVPVVIADIPSLVSYFSVNERYQRLLTLALDASCNDVLEAILYHDDIQGGNILAPSLGKKATLCYMSFMSVPKKYLLSPFAWLPVGLLTHFDLQRIDGGLSAYTSLICKQFLTTSCEKGFSLRGLHGRGCKVKLSWFTADYDAIRTTFLSRGSAGLRPCLNCANVVRKDAQLNDDMFQEISFATLDKCIPIRDAEFFKQCDRLQDLVKAGRTKKDIESLAFRLGIHYNKHGLLWNKDVRPFLPPSKVIPDTLHSYMANGIASQEIMLVWGQATALGLDTNAIFEVLNVLQLHRASVDHRTLNWQKNLFSEKKMKGDLYGGPGWECELMVPLLFFLCSRLLHAFEGISQALVSLDLLRLCCREVRLHLRFHMSKTKLLDLQQRHHKAFLEAHSPESFRPKHDHRLHIPQRPILSVAAMETKHREFKRNLCDRLQSMVHQTESNVAKAALPRMVLAHVQTMDSVAAFPSVGLFHPIYKSFDLLPLLPDHLKLEVPLVSMTAMTQDVHVAKDDILFFLDQGERFQTIQIHCCFSSQDMTHLVIEKLGFLRSECGAEYWQRSHQLEICTVINMPNHIHPLWWAKSDPDTLLTLW